jgi:hypothetical protein
MRILEVKDIVRKDVPIYYRRLYTGLAILELTGKTVECGLEFTLETKPTGLNEVIINSMDPVDYPLLPLKKEMQKFISTLDENGRLPA